VGRDYYDFIPFDPETHGFWPSETFPGRASPSALLMASLQGLVRTISPFVKERSPAFGAELNDSFYKLTASNRYATLFLRPGRTLPTIAPLRQTPGIIRPLLFRNGAPPAHDLGPAESLESGGLRSGSSTKPIRSEHVLLHEGDVLVRTRMEWSKH